MNSFPPCPASLKVVQPYLKTAEEHDARDPIISYWCRLFALQTALKVDKKSDDAKVLLVSLMDWLEDRKKKLAEKDEITNDIAASAHIENYALKLFNWADVEDRAARFNKNVVKAFFTASVLFDILVLFGEVNEEILKNCKYARWKAAHIHTCLKQGTTPIAGPFYEVNDQNKQEDESTSENKDENRASGNNVLGFENSTNENPAPVVHPTTTPSATNPTVPFDTLPTLPSVPAAPTTSNTNQSFVPYRSAPPSLPKAASGAQLDALQIAKAQKYCKFAGSALNYDDVNEAINFLRKALRLLETGEDS